MADLDTLRGLAVKLNDAAEDIMRQAWSRNDAHSLGIGANLAAEASAGILALLDENERLRALLANTRDRVAELRPDYSGQWNDALKRRIDAELGPHP